MGASIGNTEVTDLDFTDDTAIFAESLEVLVLAIEALLEGMQALETSSLLDQDNGPRV